MYYRFLVCLFLLVSCTNNQHYIFVGEEYPVDTLSTTKCFLENVIHPIFITSKNNSLIVSSIRSDTSLYLYSIPNLTYENRFGVIGNGVGEYPLAPMFVYSQMEDLYISGKLYTNIEQYTIDSLSRMSFVKEFDTDISGSCNQMHLINDSILIYNSIPDKLSIKKYNIKTKKIIDEIVIGEEGKSTFFNIDRGNISANDSIVIYSYVYKKQIDIYTINDMKLSKRIVRKSTPQNVIKENRQDLITYYVNTVAAKKHLYVLCQESTLNDYTKAKMEVYDYNANLVKQYVFDIPPILFTIDEDNGYIYGYNYNYEDYLLSYKI